MTEELKAYRSAYQNICRQDASKNELFEALLEQLRMVTEQWEQIKMDYERERGYNRQFQQKEQQLQAQLSHTMQEMQRDPFVLVLIDGDGMIFDDSFVERGEAGGKEAASLLWNQVRACVQETNKSIPLHYKIVTRIYANLKGLGEACYRASITDRSTLVEDFARGFTGSKTLFDFVDVGSGKDRADEKITEMLKLHVNNFNCHQVVFGGSHDNGYARLLEDIPSTDRSKVVLLEGVPFEKELRNFIPEYHTTRFPGLFRTTKINIYSTTLSSTLGSLPATHGAMHPPPGLPFPLVQNGNGTNGVSRYTSMSNDSTDSYPTSPSPINTEAHAMPVRSVSEGRTITTSPIPSWADKVGSTVPSGAQVNLLSASASTPEPTPIARNKLGQRIDSLMARPDPNEMRRVSKIKMCNVHYLRRDCPYGNECTHDHTYKPTKAEMELLKQINRGTPCRNGTACDDLKCMYGHRCPYSQEGSKDCRFAGNCRFGPEMHGLDTKAVRTLKLARETRSIMQLGTLYLAISAKNFHSWKPDYMLEGVDTALGPPLH